MPSLRFKVRRLGKGCSVTACRQDAVGTLWPVKVIGRPLSPGIPACQYHLDLAHAMGGMHLQTQEEQ